MGKDLADVNTLWPKPHDLSNCRDAVFCSIDVLLGPWVSCLNYSNQQGDGLWTKQTAKDIIQLTQDNQLRQHLHPQSRLVPGLTCTERAVVLSSILSHDTNTIGGSLPNLRARVAKWLHHRSQEVLSVFKRQGAAVLHNIVKDAETPLSVSPWPAGTLQTRLVSYCKPQYVTCIKIQQLLHYSQNLKLNLVKIENIYIMWLMWKKQSTYY